MKWVAPLFVLMCSSVQAQTLRPEARVEVVPVITAVETSLLPQARPKAVEDAAARIAAQRRAGSVCGVTAIQGRRVANIPGRIAGCGVSNPVKVTSVSGVRLSTAATMDCTTAKTLNRWVAQGLKPTVGSFRGGVREMHVVAHYACRTRNNQPGAKISEHGRGRAIDIAGFRMHDGSRITLLNDWGRGRAGRILKQLHARACGPFGTVLGPNANRFHKDHFHFDTARYRSGSYCR
ncbi:MAG: extensin family protein [Planktomarina sp.]